VTDARWTLFSTLAFLQAPFPQAPLLMLRQVLRLGGSAVHGLDGVSNVVVGEGKKGCRSPLDDGGRGVDTAPAGTVFQEAHSSHCISRKFCQRSTPPPNLFHLLLLVVHPQGATCCQTLSKASSIVIGKRGIWPWGGTLAWRNSQPLKVGERSGPANNAKAAIDVWNAPEVRSICFVREQRVV